MMGLARLHIPIVALPMAMRHVPKGFTLVGSVADENANGEVTLLYSSETVPEGATIDMRYKIVGPPMRQTIIFEQFGDE